MTQAWQIGKGKLAQAGHPGQDGPMTAFVGIFAVTKKLPMGLAELVGWKLGAISAPMRRK